MDDKKTYQVTYKVYHNERLKKISFHGKLIYPLYLRLTFDRKTTEYRSNLFDLFMKPKYAIRFSGEIHPPHIDKIIEREEKLIEFVIDRHKDDFSLDLFKREYDYFSRDLLDEMEPAFMEYLLTFFEDEGMPFLGLALIGSQREVSLYDVMLDFKRSLKPDLYQRLLDHSFFFAPPYFLLHQFIETPVRPPLAIFTVMDWEDALLKEMLTNFIAKQYPTQDLKAIFLIIDDYVRKSEALK